MPLCKPHTSSSFCQSPIKAYQSSHPRPKVAPKRLFQHSVLSQLQKDPLGSQSQTHLHPFLREADPSPLLPPAASPPACPLKPHSKHCPKGYSKGPKMQEQAVQSKQFNFKKTLLNKKGQSRQARGPLDQETVLTPKYYETNQTSTERVPRSLLSDRQAYHTHTSGSNHPPQQQYTTKQRSETKLKSKPSLNKQSPVRVKVTLTHKPLLSD